MSRDVVKRMRDQHGNSKYPWYKWLSGRAYKVRQGRDFDVTKQQFQNLLHVTAKRRGLKLQSRSLGEWVTFQFSVDKTKKKESKFEKMAKNAE